MEASAPTAEVEVEEEMEASAPTAEVEVEEEASP